MTKQDKPTEVLHAVDPTELATIEGGYIWDSSCPSYPTEDPFAPFGPPMPIGPIILC